MQLLHHSFHLILSFSGTNKKECKSQLTAKRSVAIVFRSQLPEKLWGYDVIDGDKNDLRFLDPPGVVVGLRAKGFAKRDKDNKMVLEV